VKFNEASLISKKLICLAMCYSATILIAVAARGCLCATTPTILCMADDLANEYSLPSTERRANQNLDTMEQLCQTAEMGPSDEEFV